MIIFFTLLAMILGDGLYNFIKVLYYTLSGLYRHLNDDKTKAEEAITGNSLPDLPSLSYDDQKRTRLFLKDQIPTWIAIVGYLTIAIVSIINLPHIFHQLKWYYVAAIYLAIFVIGAWAGGSNGGVLAGLAACGVRMNIVSTASDLTQDFKTGYMTLASPRSMFVSQVIGTAMGCIISPCVFWLFYNSFDNLGVPGSEYPAPYALIFRNMAILGVEGFSTLPEKCLLLCYIFFGFAIFVNGIRDLVGKNLARFIPIPMAMAIPFYIGGKQGKGCCIRPVVASGLICGDAIWTLPSSILALAGVNPPICMKFLSRSTNIKVDAFSGCLISMAVTCV
ncbi:putative oligopeptide transporter, OPT superfamily [Helianthus anomalus]